MGLNAEFVPPHDTGASLYVRPVAFGVGPNLVLAPGNDYIFTVYVTPTGNYHGHAPVAALVLEAFDRAAPRGTGHAKVGGNYAPVLRHQQAAQAEGYGITLHLDAVARRDVDEFSTSAFVGVEYADKGVAGEPPTLLAPTSPSTIRSVTQDSVCDIAESWGWKVERGPVPWPRLAALHEVWGVGTAAALVPVKSITRRSTGEAFELRGVPGGRPQWAWEKMMDALKGYQLGKLEDRFGWLDYVEEPRGFASEVANGATNDSADPIELANGKEAAHRP